MSHVLGIKSNHIDDTLVVSRDVNRDLKSSITQRKVFSLVSSVCELKGLEAPYTLRARFLLEIIWRIRCQQLDSDVPIDIKTKCFAWHSGLSSSGKMSERQSFFTAPIENVDLLMFGNSSEGFFYVVAFLRALINTSLEIQISFVYTKARVKPMKELSIIKESYSLPA